MINLERSTLLQVKKNVMKELYYLRNSSLKYFCSFDNGKANFKYSALMSHVFFSKSQAEKFKKELKENYNTIVFID